MVSVNPKYSATNPIADGGLDPFSVPALNAIFKLAPNSKTRVKSRENTRLEFKETFHFNNLPEYARTGAAFANHQGGYIVFGVADKPRRLVGIRTTKFEELDPARMTEILNGIFEPSLAWQATVYEMDGRKFGLLCFAESETKPVMCTKTCGQRCVDGEIYYRYRGQTRKIKSAELRALIQAQREHEAKKWQRVFREIVRVGIENAAVLDVTTGEAKAGGRSVILDPEAVPNLRFLKEGEFSEQEGAPAYRVVGEAHVANTRVLVPGKTVTRHIRIDEVEIIRAFLEKRKADHPIHYLEQICHERTSRLPIYYYAKQAGLDQRGLAELVANEQVREFSKTKLLKRINGEDNFALRTNQNRKQCAALFKSQKLPSQFEGREMHYACQAIQTMGPGAANSKYVRTTLLEWLDRYYAASDITIDAAFRNAVCHVDRINHRSW